MSEMSLREYARHRGVTHQAVRKALARGRITALRQERGRIVIDSEAADAAWRSNTDPALQRGAQAQTRVNDQTGRAYASARAVREQYEARMARLTFEEKSGKLVQADEVKVAAFNSARGARDALQGIPDRIAPMLTGVTDTRMIHRIITEEVTRVCEMLSGPPPADAA